MLRSEDVLQQIGATPTALMILSGGQMPQPPVRLLAIEVGFLACHLPPVRQEELEPHILALVERDDWCCWYELAEQHNDRNSCLGHLAVQRLARHADNADALIGVWELCDPNSALAGQILQKLHELNYSGDWWREVLDEMGEDGYDSRLYQLCLQIMLQKASTFYDCLVAWQRAPARSYYRKMAMDMAEPRALGIDDWWQAFETIIKGCRGQYAPAEEELIGRHLIDGVKGQEVRYPEESFDAWDKIRQAATPGSDLHTNAIAGMLRMLPMTRTPWRAMRAWTCFAPDAPERELIIHTVVSARDQPTLS